MKLFLAIAMTTLFSATAFGACSASSAQECKTKSECDSISTAGQKFNFTNGRCMVVSSQETATDCAGIADSSLGKSVPTASGAPGVAPTGGRQR